MKKANEKFDLYQIVTDKIVASMEDALKWNRPWRVMGVEGAPINVASKKAYRGVNIMLLSGASHWGSYKQWAAKGAQVRKGEKGTLCVFWKILKKSELSDSGKKVEKTIPMLRYYNVFHAGQVDGWVSPVVTGEAVVDHVIHAHKELDEAFAKTGIRVNFGGDRAFYSPSMDVIGMPTKEQFHDTGAFYSTLAHEFAHATGHKSRLDRDQTGSFGSKSYAFEELVAELSAAFVMTQVGLSSEPREDHASYLKHWLDALTSDKKAIFSAASKARLATEMLVGKPVVEEEEEETKEAA